MKNKLRDKLLEDYTVHYKRVNKSVSQITQKSRDSFVAMYGRYLTILPQNSLVLDAGCGTGLLLQHLSVFNNLKLVGVDISQGQINIARASLLNAELICADALDYLQAHKKKFSAIFCMDVIEHLPNDDDCLDLAEALYGALVPRGFCIIRSPNAANMTASYSRYMDMTHKRSFTRTSLLQLMDVAGFQNCGVIPVASPHFTGKVRLGIEHAIHRALFLICGSGLEYIFTSNIICIGYAP